jgi:hypothetical protein
LLFCSLAKPVSDRQCAVSAAVKLVLSIIVVHSPGYDYGILVKKPEG